MGYRKDDDLEFLRECTSQDLDILVTILTKDSAGTVRLTEELTLSEPYKRHAPDHHQYWELVAAELQLFGGSTIANIARGNEGVSYKELLSDACGKMKVNFNPNASTEVIEQNLLMKVLTDSMDKMTPEQLKDLVQSMDLKTTNFTKQAVVAAVQAGVGFGGFAAYRVAVVVANAVAKAVVGRGLAVAANAGLARAMGVVAGPIGWVITALWTILDVAGPAYRVTMPAAVQVAFLRAQVGYRKLNPAE